jgi:hypothetical protein
MSSGVSKMVSIKKLKTHFLTKTLCVGSMLKIEN